MTCTKNERWVKSRLTWFPSYTLATSLWRCVGGALRQQQTLAMVPLQWRRSHLWVYHKSSQAHWISDSQVCADDLHSTIHIHEEYLAKYVVGRDRRNTVSRSSLRTHDASVRLCWAGPGAITNSDSGPVVTRNRTWTMDTPLTTTKNGPWTFSTRNKCSR